MKLKETTRRKVVSFFCAIENKLRERLIWIFVIGKIIFIRNSGYIVSVKQNTPILVDDLMR